MAAQPERKLVERVQHVLLKLVDVSHREAPSFAFPVGDVPLTEFMDNTFGEHYDEANVLAGDEAWDQAFKIGREMSLPAGDLSRRWSSSGSRRPEGARCVWGASIRIRREQGLSGRPSAVLTQVGTMRKSGQCAATRTPSYPDVPTAVGAAPTREMRFRCSGVESE